MVAHMTFNHGVVGSSPIVNTKFPFPERAREYRLGIPIEYGESVVLMSIMQKALSFFGALAQSAELYSVNGYAIEYH